MWLDLIENSFTSSSTHRIQVDITSQYFTFHIPTFFLSYKSNEPSTHSSVRNNIFFIKFEIFNETKMFTCER
jgi:hypothetical protein